MLHEKENIYWQGNRNLRNNGITLDYTKEQIKEIVKCNEDIIYFVKNYYYIVNLDKGLMKFTLYPFQENLISDMYDSSRLVVLAPRQSGKTSTSAAYLLHYVLFNENKTVAILANKEVTSREILSRIKQAYELLPLWLQQGITSWNKGSITLENGSKIVASSTSSSAIRGMSVNVLYVDETAFILRNIWEDFYSSIYPTVASSKDSVIIMASTPWGLNHFYKLYTEAEEGINGFNYFKVKWDDIPGRDKEWRKKTIAEIGERKFQQEFQTRFLGSSGTLIDGDKLEILAFKNPIEMQDDDRFKIYEYPQISEKEVEKEGKKINTKVKHQYVCFCDVGEGVGADASTVQVVDVTEMPYKQVATFSDNIIKTNIFPEVIFKIGEYYHNALVVVEANTYGQEILHLLNYDLEYENIFYTKKDWGIKMNKATKKIGNGQIKSLIEDDKIILCDFDTITQFGTYVERRKTFKAEDGENDDLVTPLVLFGYFMSKKDLTENWLGEVNVRERLYAEKLKQIEEDLLPVGFIVDGNDVRDLENPEMD